MKVLMFGHLNVQSPGRVCGPRDLGGIKPKQLLEILLLARGHFVSTEAITDSLWPSNLPKNVAATINTYVSVLRKRLFEDRSTARRTLISAPHAYRFELTDADVDIVTFDDLLKRSERAGRAERISLLCSATDLLAGDLLEDAPYDEWVQNDRSLYRARAARAHLTLSRDWLVERDAARALRSAEAAQRIAPYSEEAIRLKMLSNHALGMPDAARVEFDRGRTCVEADLGTTLCPETTSLAWAISSGVDACEIIDRLTNNRLTPIN